MTSHASLNTPSNLKEIWRQLDQGILPESLGGKPQPPTNFSSTTATPTTTTTTTMSSSKKVNVAIIGYGLSAKIFHIPLILAVPEVYTLYGIVQRTPKPDDDCAKDHPGIQSWRSADDLFADKAVDLVIVSSLPDTHFSFAKQALESGKHVVVEKPFVGSSAEARELSKLAKEKGVLLSVYQNRRWDLDFLTLKKVLDSGVLGDIAEFETHYDRFIPDKVNKLGPAAGVAFDLGSHLVDQVYHLYGPPKSVTGFVQVQKRGGTLAKSAADALTAILRYGNEEDEMLVTVKGSSISPCDEQLRYLVRGSKGSFRKYYLDPQEVQMQNGIMPGHADFGSEDSSHHGLLTTPDPSSPKKFKSETYPSVKPATYVEYYRVLASALQGKGDVPVSADDAADVLKIIEMAYESSKTGRSLTWGEEAIKATMI